MTEAHDRTVSVKFLERWPEHTPRQEDPYYKYFRDARRRMQQAGLLKCNFNSTTHYGLIELHHDKIEYGHINDTDLHKFNDLYGLHLSDEDFKIYVESEGNLEPLCTMHHRGILGVHSLPEPEWNALRTAKNPDNMITVQFNSLIPVQHE